MRKESIEYITRRTTTIPGSRRISRPSRYSSTASRMGQIARVRGGATTLSSGRSPASRCASVFILASVPSRFIIGGGCGPSGSVGLCFTCTFHRSISMVVSAWLGKSLLISPRMKSAGLAIGGHG